MKLHNEIIVRHQRPRRRGISLIEVIACTALVTIMLVPIAAVIRASRQSISVAQGNASSHAEVRSGLAWLTQSIREGTVHGYDSRYKAMKLELQNGHVVEVTLRNSQLQMIDGALETVVIDNVKDVAFKPISATSGNTIGIGISIDAYDAKTGSVIDVWTMVAQPPQFQTIDSDTSSDSSASGDSGTSGPSRRPRR
ncbi:hypothetical protein [Planctomycetes bacterium CA13]